MVSKTVVGLKVIDRILFENNKVLTKFNSLLGQWMREKEDLLMRDLYASSVSYVNATGGTNGDMPSNISRNDINNIERILLNNDARTVLQSIKATDFFATAPTRDAFIALAGTQLTSDLQNISGVLLKNAYDNKESVRPEEYCSVSRFRFFVSSKNIVQTNASMLGADVFSIPMFGVEAATKIEQNMYTARVGYIPAWVASTVAQNSILYGKFSFAAAITNQNWISGLNVTQRL